VLWYPQTPENGLRRLDAFNSPVPITPQEYARQGLPVLQRVFAALLKELRSEAPLTAADARAAPSGTRVDTLGESRPALTELQAALAAEAGSGEPATSPTFARAAAFCVANAAVARRLNLRFEGTLALGGNGCGFFTLLPELPEARIRALMGVFGKLDEKGPGDWAARCRAVLEGEPGEHPRLGVLLCAPPPPGLGAMCPPPPLTPASPSPPHFPQTTSSISSTLGGERGSLGPSSCRRLTGCAHSRPPKPRGFSS
jgi:hypothetical protein